MLDRNKAEDELKQAIQQLEAGLPAWGLGSSMEKFSLWPRGAMLGGVTLGYLDELLRILPEYGVPPKPVKDKTDVSETVESKVEASQEDTESKSQVEETSQQRLKQITAEKVDLLRRRLTNILENEISLKLKKELCDIAFRIKLALAKAFPLNDAVLVDDQGSELKEETWVDPIMFGQLTRDTPNLVVFSQAAAITQEAAIRHYASNIAYDEDGNPRDLNNTLLSKREIASLRSQGISFKLPASVVQQRAAVFALNNSWGSYIGTKIGQIVIVYFALSCLMVPAILFGIPSLALTMLAPAIVSGITTARAAEPEFGLIRGFLVGVAATLLFGGVALSLFLAGVAALFASSVISHAAGMSAMNIFGLFPLPILLPAVILGTAQYIAYTNNQNLTTTLFNFINNVFYATPVWLFSETGRIIGDGIWEIYQTLRAFVGVQPQVRPANNNIPQLNAALVRQLDRYFNSHAQIMSSIPRNNSSPEEEKAEQPNLNSDQASGVDQSDSVNSRFDVLVLSLPVNLADDTASNEQRGHMTQRI